MEQQKSSLPPPMPDVQLPPPNNWLEKRYTYSELQNADLPDPEWLVPSLIPNPGLVAFTGRPGHFKTFFMQWVAMRLAAGLNMFDHWDGPAPMKMNESPKEPIGVVFIEEEMNARMVKERSNDMRSWEGQNFHWFISAGFSLKDKEKVAQLRAFVEENNIKLLIFDPFTSVSQMKDENNNSEAREVMDTIRHEFVDTDHGCTVVFIHHPAKGEHGDSIRGAGDILGKCDMHFTVEKVDDNGTKIKIENRKTRYKQPFDFYAEMINSDQDLGRLEWQFRGTVADEKKKAKDELGQKILSSMHVGVEYTKSDVADNVDIHKKSKRFEMAWDTLVEGRNIVRKGRYSWVKNA